MLGALFNKLVVNGNYEGFVVVKEKVHIPILQFESMLMKLKDTITLSEWCSMHKVNGEKSALYGVNVEENELKYMAGRTRCSTKNMPFLYLGLPFEGVSETGLFLAAHDW